MHSQSPPLIHRDLKPTTSCSWRERRSRLKNDRLWHRPATWQVAEDAAWRARRASTPRATPRRSRSSASRSRAATSSPWRPRSTTWPRARPPRASTRPGAGDPAGADPHCPYPPPTRWFFELIKINLAEDANDRYFSAREIKGDLDRQQVTREVRCPKCQVANKVRSPYCVKCAEALTDPTPRLARPAARPPHGQPVVAFNCGNRLRVKPDHGSQRLGPDPPKPGGLWARLKGMTSGTKNP